MSQTAVTDDALALASDLHQQVVQLTRAVHVLRANLTAHTPSGGQWSTYVLLSHLATGGPQRASALAESVFVDPSTISRQVDQLAKLGLVERRADPQDGRATLLAATEEGLELHRTMRARRDLLTAGLLAHWSADDVRTLTHLLSRFTGEITDNMPALLCSLGRTAPTSKDLS
jgi:DNA-binding MarR family transcriptional regulator